jgi:hypothetical protein
MGEIYTQFDECKDREIIERTGGTRAVRRRQLLFKSSSRANFAACAGNAIASISREQTTLP